MKEEINIKQIFLNHDLRAGRDSLSCFLDGQGKKLKKLNKYECYLFMNTQKNIIKVVAKEGMFTDKLNDNQTYDFSIRYHQIFAKIGKFFGITYHVPTMVYNRVQRVIEVKHKATQARDRVSQVRKTRSYLRQVEGGL